MPNTPLTTEKFEAEVQRIKQIANVNGYTEQLINDLLKAHLRKKDLRNHTTLELIRDDSEANLGWTSFSYNPSCSSKFKSIFKKHNINLARVPAMKPKIHVND